MVSNFPQGSLLRLINAVCSEVKRYRETSADNFAVENGAICFSLNCDDDSCVVKIPLLLSNCAPDAIVKEVKATIGDAMDKM